MLSLLFEVVSLQIVDDRKVVDVASISRYVPVTARLSKLVELVHKRTYQGKVKFKTDLTYHHSYIFGNQSHRLHCQVILKSF